MLLPEPIEFLWDSGNIDKNRLKHGISNEETEEAFLDEGKRIAKDILHSKKEKRYILLGQTKKQRILFIVFTIRNKKIRVISARIVNKKEVYLYEKTA